MDHIKLLKQLNTCGDAVAWCESYKSLSACWRHCKRADWLLWFAAKVGVDRKIVVSAACACAETSLKYIKNKEKKQAAKNAIQIAREWTKGRATKDKVRMIAADAATAASAAAAAAYTAAAYTVANATTAAAYAAADASSSAAASFSAATTADDDAAAAYAAAAACAAAAAYAAVAYDDGANAAAAAKKESHAAMCKIIKEYISWKQIKEKVQDPVKNKK